MAVKAREIQSYVWKMITYSSKTCISCTQERPCISVSLLCLFLLYICLPLFFWFLIYSIPFIVFASVVLTASSSGRNKKENEGCDNYAATRDDHAIIVGNNHGKYMARVHSVRRIRAKEIDVTRDENEVKDMAVEEKAAISSTSLNHDVVDKETLIESGPKDIRVVSSSAPRIRILADSDDDDDDKRVPGIKDTDLGISEAERIKRLENLIARRRSRKLLSFQIRRTLLNMDRNPKNNIPRLSIPKNNMVLTNNSIGCQLSPSPGSAPSVLVPMRNPFDLPYDPQEEKPNLSIQTESKELDNGRVVRYCRHESFSTRGLFLPKEEESGLNKEGDEIKEIIRVHENEITNTHDEEEERDCSARLSNSSSSSSSSSEEENEKPFQKIDKEAVLKSLSSMARRNLNNDDELTDRNDSILHRMPDNKVLQRHTPSYSIASDMQVEVSEVSSPPLTIDENLSYRDEDVSMCDGDVECNNKNWGSSSYLCESEEENELSLREIPEVTKQDVIEAEFNRNMRFKETKKTSNDPCRDESENNSNADPQIGKFEAEADEHSGEEEEYAKMENLQFCGVAESSMTDENHESTETEIEQKDESQLRTNS